jgi:hypothetical protein
VAEIPARLLGRDFGADALREVQRLVLDCLPRTRTEIARQLCRCLGWTGPGGQPAVMSARVALLRLHRAGWIQLPPARTLGGNARRLPPPAPILRSEPVEGSLDQVPPVILRPVQDQHQSKLWNGLIAHYHYLGHSTLPGAQIRFLVYLGDQPAGAVGFGASAWQISARDRFIGWTSQQRQARLHLILNNARFLILDWIRVKNLASHVLGLCSRRLPQDFQARYGWAPVLLESFVEQGRFAGLCYRAANWLPVGHTTGRGKKGPNPGPGNPAGPLKQVWLCPLRSDFRRRLCEGSPEL